MKISWTFAMVGFALALVWSSAVQAAVTRTTIMVGVHRNMRAELFVPDGPGPYPGVLVLHTSGGLREPDLLAAQQLADAGYVCLVPAFMAAYGLTYDSRRDTFARDGDAIFADLVDAADTLRRNSKVNNGKLGAIGFSNGGYFAVWLALSGNVQAAVSYYGAYTGAGGDIAETRFKRLATSSAAPILILHGLDDDTVPVEAARRLAGILGGAAAPYEMQLYPGTGHSFDRGGSAPPLGVRGGNRGFRGVPAGGGSEDNGDRAASADAWVRTLAFFQKYLQAP